jgi:hypothetical protein
VPGANSVGGLADSETPEAFGPRNCGHHASAALAGITAVIATAKKESQCFVIVGLILEKTVGRASSKSVTTTLVILSLMSVGRRVGHAITHSKSTKPWQGHGAVGLASGSIR